ncbi:MAG: lipase maturation factor family protein [Myxococcota bacterium]|nr:lipase maturation factor family protein [Myxococcota bacterium]
MSTLAQAPDEDEIEARRLRPRPEYSWTRTVLLHALSFVYLIAFLILAEQHAPLLGSDGLLPVRVFAAHVRESLGSNGAAFWRLPSVFWFGDSDAMLSVCASIGVVLSALGCLGFGNALGFAALWILYLSFVHVGQIFYGYGWESLLCEAGFLAIFLAPPTALRFANAPEPPRLMLVLFRWLTFRVMFGAGLIKLRGDPCWMDLTCLDYHYETQPNPNPLSPILHRMPALTHRVGVLVNHAVELVAPFFVFGPRRARLIAGTAIIGFQVLLILSGNLSFLNWLTIAVALACFDDGVFAFVTRRLPRRPPQVAGKLWRGIGIALAAVIGLLSINPIVNLLSPRQAMNRSFDPFQLVNTYGAFGSVGKERRELVFEGTAAELPDQTARWLPYEFPCKPGDPMRPPCLVSPYHYRLDWQLWFLAMGRLDQPWALNLVYKLLKGDPGVRTLLAHDPFPERPPRYLRILEYRYRFTREGEKGTWHRELLGTKLRPIAVDDPELLGYLQLAGLI